MGQVSNFFYIELNIGLFFVYYCVTPRFTGLGCDILLLYILSIYIAMILDRAPVFYA